MKSTEVLRRGYGLLRSKLEAASYSEKFKTVEEGLRINGHPNISGTGIIHAGHHLYVDSCSIVPTVMHTCKKSSIINIGNCLYIGPPCERARLYPPQTTIYGSDWHGIDGNETKFAPMKIGKHVWDCRSVIILKGVVEIGDNSIIAAGSIVTKDVAENTFVAGCPARKIRPTTGLTRSHWVEMRLKP